MKLNKNHLDILDHTINRAARGLFCGGSKEMDELVEMGLMKFAGTVSWCPDKYYSATIEGHEVYKDSCREYIENMGNKKEFIKIMNILNIKIKSREFPEEMTLKEYFKLLLSTLWDEKERFSGKRPFGNSDWEYDIYAALIKNKLVEGKLDEWGYIEEVDEKSADELIWGAIQAL